MPETDFWGKTAIWFAESGVFAGQTRKVRSLFLFTRALATAPGNKNRDMPDRRKNTWAKKQSQESYVWRLPFYFL